VSNLKILTKRLPAENPSQLLVLFPKNRTRGFFDIYQAGLQLALMQKHR
jgi:hypothetical protein